MSHGSRKFEIVAPISRFYQGPFGRIFSNLPAWAPEGVNPRALDTFFLDFADEHMVEEPGKTPTEIATTPALIAKLETAFSSNVPAGYTYFGQFVDHDITFDPVSSLMRQNDPSGLLNHRTPRLDLDNVYGRGPKDSPYLYDAEDSAKFLIGCVEGSDLRDLPRNQQGRALIGDMRNDENAMVSQLQLAFLLAHNTLVDRVRALHPRFVNDATLAFETARKTLRWLYQHIVWNDFIKRITSDKIHECALNKQPVLGKHKKWDLGLRDVYNWSERPFMPVEFSIAAYRFGHSMVRNSYRTNFPHRGLSTFAPIFDNTSGGTPDDLRGFRPMLKENVIQWDWFLQMTSSQGDFPQMARKIDTKLSNALTVLHEGPPGSSMNVLAFRNLKRAHTFGLPSGTAVAKKLCFKPIKIDQDQDSLWFYILKEAEKLPALNAGQMLGPVGSTIVCATFAGLLKGDPTSYINIEPCWEPADDPLLHDGIDNQDDADWTLASIIRLSGLPVSFGDF